MVVIKVEDLLTEDSVGLVKKIAEGLLVGEIVDLKFMKLQDRGDYGTEDESGTPAEIVADALMALGYNHKFNKTSEGFRYSV